MSFFVDLIVIAVFVIALIAGWRKGFVRAIMRVVSLVGAVLTTWFLYKPVADFLYNKIFLSSISNYIQRAFDRDVAATGKSLSQLFAELPEFFTNFLNRFSTAEKASEFFAGNSDATSGALSKFMAQPIAQTVSKVTAIIVLFFAAYFILMLLTRLLDKVVKLPLLNGVNKALGIALGALVGLAIAWVLAIAFHALLPQLNSLYPEAFKENTFENTLIVRNLYNFNLFTVIDLFKF